MKYKTLLICMVVVGILLFLTGLITLIVSNYWVGLWLVLISVAVNTTTITLYRWKKP